MELNEIYSRAILHLRTKHNQTQEFVYHHSGIQVCNYECAKRMPRKKTIEGLCCHFELGFEDFQRAVQVASVTEWPIEGLIDKLLDDLEFRKKSVGQPISADGILQ